MPARDIQHWQSKIGQASPCHYGDYWLDLYADLIRKKAVRRIWPRGVLRVLDVGCGDGRFGAWLKRAFWLKEVSGIDVFRWPGVEGRLDRFYVEDAEWVDSLFVRGFFDLAVCVTSLPFMQDWRRAIYSLTSIVRAILVVENLQTPTPAWQRGLPEKDPIEFSELVAEMRLRSFLPAEAVCVNVLDRRWFPRAPHVILSPLACVSTLAADSVLARMTRPDRGRYAAVLFQSTLADRREYACTGRVASTPVLSMRREPQ